MPIEKVLVIDDEEPIRTMMEDILDLFDVRMVGAETGEEALEILEKEDFDFIICDLNLPDMDGKEFFRLSVERKPEVGGKFAFSTGFAQDPDLQRFCENHKIQFLSKPFRVEDIQRLLNL